MASLETFGPTAGDAGENLGEDFMIGVLGPMIADNGVDGVPGVSTALAVYGDSGGRRVLVRPGTACIRGLGYQLSGDDLVIPLTTNTSGNTRVDRIVIRHDPSLGDARQASIVAVLGTPGAGAPSLVRIAGGIWDVPLATVSCAPAYTSITPANVTDARQWLPFAVVYADSRQPGFPPVDGSGGRVVWDTNPSVNALLIPVAGIWQRLISTADLGPLAGWQDLGTFGGFAPFYGGTRCRRVGKMIELRFHIYGTSNNSTITALPEDIKPDDTIVVPIYCDDNSQGWNARIPGAGDNTPLELIAPFGGGTVDPTGKAFWLSHMYFTG